jgi:NAD(P)-dependent dehydrogenase (short-subunit alcohol dehydrogenase family)
MSSIRELSSLNGRVALVTGATGGLGTVFADTLAELGADLILIDRPGSDFDLITTSLVKRWGINVETYVCDLENQSQRSEFIKKLEISGTGLSVLVNNAAFTGESNLEGWNVPFQDQSLVTWRRALEVNLTSVFHLCQGVFPLLMKSNGANIVNIGSIYGVYAPDWNLYKGTEMNNPAAYGVSKAGLLQLTRWLATNLAPNVRVNAISPGGLFRNQPIEFVKRYEKVTPLGRMANEDDLRGALAFLASDMSRYVTGENLVVDGGWGV